MANFSFFKNKIMLLSIEATKISPICRRQRPAQTEPDVYFFCLPHHDNTNEMILPQLGVNWTTLEW
jgi:hypothetical protein